LTQEKLMLPARQILRGYVKRFVSL